MTSGAADRYPRSAPWQAPCGGCPVARDALRSISPRRRRPAGGSEGRFTVGVLRTVESKLEGLVEGVFNRAFRARVQPVELARRLAKEMESYKAVSVSRTYVPNEYIVFLSREDRRQFEGYEPALLEELASHLLEHAAREGLALLTRPKVSFETDKRLRMGEFGIQARLVKPPESDEEEASQGDLGATMVYSATKVRAGGRRAGGRAAGRAGADHAGRQDVRARPAAGGGGPQPPLRLRARGPERVAAALRAAAARRRTGTSWTSSRPTASPSTAGVSRARASSRATRSRPAPRACASTSTERTSDECPIR